MAGKFYIKHEGRKIYRETAAAITKLARELADATGIGVPVYTEVVGVGARAGSVHRDAPFVRNPLSEWKQYHHSYSWLTKRAATAGLKSVRERYDDGSRAFKLSKVSDDPPRYDVIYKMNVKRNPVGMEHAEHMLRMSGERQRRDANMARRMSDDYFPPAKAVPASRAGRYIVRATKAGKVQTVKVSTLEKAREVAQAFAENGYRAVVDTGNPSSKRARENIYRMTWRGTDGQVRSKDFEHRDDALRFALDLRDEGHPVLETKMKSNPATKASKARRTASNKRGAFVEYTEGGVKKRIKYGNKGIATIRAAAMKRDGWRGVRVVSA